QFRGEAGAGPAGDDQSGANRREFKRYRESKRGWQILGRFCGAKSNEDPPQVEPEDNADRQSGDAGDWQSAEEMRVKLSYGFPRPNDRRPDRQRSANGECRIASRGFEDREHELDDNATKSREHIPWATRRILSQRD